MLRSKLSNLQPRFAFAGFSWPRHVATLECGSLAARLADRKAPFGCGNYYHAPSPNNTAGRGFYLNSSGRAEGLRYETTGNTWRAGEDSFQGIVLRLPHGRGFLAGWTMGEGTASSLDYEIYEDIDDATRAADSLAESAADRQAEDNERFETMTLAELDVEIQTEELEKSVALRHREKFGGRPRVRRYVEKLRAARETLADATRAYERG